MYLSLPVPAGRTKVVVQELIDEFVKPELLDKEDAWNCPRCKVPRRAAKSLTISRLPPVLLIQLKRFTTQNGVFWDKSETPVIFPVKGLDLTRYVPHRQPTGREDLDDPRTQVGPFKYDLYGVSNHMGTLSSGHCESCMLMHVHAKRRYGICKEFQGMDVLRRQPRDKGTREGRRGESHAIAFRCLRKLVTRANPSHGPLISCKFDPIFRYEICADV